MRTGFTIGYKIGQKFIYLLNNYYINYNVITARPLFNLDPILKTLNISLFELFKWSRSENHIYHINKYEMFCQILCLP